VSVVALSALLSVVGTGFAVCRRLRLARSHAAAHAARLSPWMPQTRANCEELVSGREILSASRMRHSVVCGSCPWPARFSSAAIHKFFCALAITASDCGEAACACLQVAPSSASREGVSPAQRPSKDL
jgi:hypothetical protein